jgi:hypothetical protein
LTNQPTNQRRKGREKGRMERQTNGGRTGQWKDGRLMWWALYNKPRPCLSLVVALTVLTDIIPSTVYSDSTHKARGTQRLHAKSMYWRGNNISTLTS